MAKHTWIHVCTETVKLSSPRFTFKLLAFSKSEDELRDLKTLLSFSLPFLTSANAHWDSNPPDKAWKNLFHSWANTDESVFASLATCA
jgi:hypothetical protein